MTDPATTNPGPIEANARTKPFGLVPPIHSSLQVGGLH
jgi:hypothetical protein